MNVQIASGKNMPRAFASIYPEIRIFCPPTCHSFYDLTLRLKILSPNPRFKRGFTQLAWCRLSLISSNNFTIFIFRILINISRLIGFLVVTFNLLRCGLLLIYHRFCAPN
jgi:hypothetical protein